MKKVFFLIAFFALVGTSFSQMSFADIGSQPAECRISSTQNGGGMVWASATGGTAPISYLWVNLSTGATSTQSTWVNLAGGNYKITATDAGSNSIVDTVLVDSINPVANFAVSGSGLSGGGVSYYGSAPITPTFQNLSTGVVNPSVPTSDTTFYWQFTQFEAFTQINSYNDQSYTYSYGGDWGVTLVAVNTNGCSDTVKVTIYLSGTAALEEEKNQFVVQRSENSVFIKFIGNSSQKQLKFFDLGGKMVEMVGFSSEIAVIPWPHLDGIYVFECLDIETNQLISTGKFQF
jgi:hypothetical protein